MSLDIQINQANLNGYTDMLASNSSGVYARANRRGELVVPEFFSELGLEGRAFSCSNTAVQTALASGGTSFSATAPSFSMDVPSGTVVVPTGIRLNQGGTVAGAVITVLVTWDVALRYGSAGTALNSYNMRTDKPYNSAVTWYTGATTAAATNQNLLYGAILKADVSSSPMAAEQFVNLNQKNCQFPILVGPAAIVIFTFAGTTQPSWFYNFQWIEFSKAVAI